MIGGPPLVLAEFVEGLSLSLAVAMARAHERTCGADHRLVLEGFDMGALKRELRNAGL